MFQGYFDESGSFDEQPNVFCISGYIITSKDAIDMDREWGEVLLEHGIPYFHMVDCAHGNPPFSRKSKDERSEIARKLIELVKKYTIRGFSVIVRRDAFEFISSDIPDIYSYLADMAIEVLAQFLEHNRVSGDLAYFFESGHKSGGRAYSMLAEKLSERSATVSFAGKDKVRLLQAADLLAWQTTKYAKDCISRERPPRKDFMSLMEHGHSFFYISQVDGEKAMTIELWPLSERTKSTVEFKANHDGPIPHVINEQGVPMILAEVMGYQAGDAHMAYVHFSAMNTKPFILSFDQQRLTETLVTIASATQLYGDRSSSPRIQAKAVSCALEGNNVVLKVEVFTGATVTFTVPKETFNLGKGVNT